MSGHIELVEPDLRSAEVLQVQTSGPGIFRADSYCLDAQGTW